MAVDNQFEEITSIGVRAGKFLEVRRIFARISPNLLEKFGSLFVRLFSHNDRPWDELQKEVFM